MLLLKYYEIIHVLMFGTLLCKYEEMFEEPLKAQNSATYRGTEKKTARSRKKGSEETWETRRECS